MKRIAVFLVVLLFIPQGSEKELPFSESVTMQHADDQYSLYIAVPVYVKKGHTYEEEERIIRVKIGPQHWWLHVESNSVREYKDTFLKVAVSIEITDGEGRLQKDFKSYLNCNMENCDPVNDEGLMVWDHAGEKRADNAGELFAVDTPLIVEDVYVRASVNLVSFLKYGFSLCSPHLGTCESDYDCLFYLKGITLELTFDYSPAQKRLKALLEEAFAHEKAGDESFQKGEFDQALQEYMSANRIYHQLGDTVRADSIQVQVHIEGIDPEKASEHVTAGDEFFQKSEFDEALREYEKALKIYSTIHDEKNMSAVQESIERCTSYQKAVEIFNVGTQLFEEAETINDWKAVGMYKEARSHFEDARFEFDQLGDSEKADECTRWMNRCDEEIGRVDTEKEGSKPESNGFPLVQIGLVGCVGIAVLLLAVLKYHPAEEIPKKKPEPEELVLKYRLAAGEITIEEYEELKSILDGE